MISRRWFLRGHGQILDAGRTYNMGNLRRRSRFGSVEIENFSKDRPAQTLLGAEQKAWFLERLRTSKATWKIWGNTTATLDMRADPQNLPPGMTKPWPGKGFLLLSREETTAARTWSAARFTISCSEHGITGFTTVAGDRHSFWAGLAAKSLPPNHLSRSGLLL